MEAQKKVSSAKIILISLSAECSICIHKEKEERMINSTIYKPMQ